MKIDIKHLDNSEKEISVVMTPKDMEPFLNSAVERLSKNLKIRGFREGHIPRDIIENKLGKQRIWQEAAEAAIEGQYLDILSENKIEPIGRPALQILKIVPDNDFEFKLTVPVLPNVELPDYKGIAKKVLNKDKNDVTVSNEEVDKALNWLWQSRASTDENSKTKPPKIDDDFAKSLGEFKNLQELRDNLKKNILQDKQQKAKQALRLKILEEISKNIKLDIPKSLIEQEVDAMQQELEQQVAGMNITLEKYLENAKQTLQDVRKGWKDRAQQRVESSILLKLISNKENIEVSEEEIEAEANKYLQHFRNIEEAQEKVDPNSLHAYISGIIKNEKVFELLESNSK